MSTITEKVCLIGFSTGGALSLRLAAERPQKLTGVAAVSVPVKFRNRHMIFVPILHGIQKLVQWMWSLEGPMPFRLNGSEHPNINYRHIPVRGLFELGQLVDDMKSRLDDITCPVAVIQGTEDPIVDPKSAELVLDNIASKETMLHMVPATRHGILSEDIGGTQELVTSFLGSLAPTPDMPSCSGREPH